MAIQTSVAGSIGTFSAWNSAVIILANWIEKRAEWFRIAPAANDFEVECKQADLFADLKYGRD
jgi:hypothetical protein